MRAFKPLKAAARPFFLRAHVSNPAAQLTLELMMTRREMILAYFQRVDERSTDLFDLFTDDVELFFPKFGTARGKDGMRAFGAAMSEMLGHLRHDIEGLRFIEADDAVVVEGREWGEMADGTAFPDGEVSQGLFCNVFEFRDGLISAVRIYVDPDFPSLDKQRVAALRR